jgi:LmbE family N-acetylglucosaminyl deacetylase
MLELEFPRHRPLELVLLLGAHCDDIEIGMGGTLLKLVERHPYVQFVWATLSSDPIREQETRAAAERLLAGATRKIVIVETFRGSFFPYEGAAIKSFFETLKAYGNPDLVFTHYRHDLHQDHRITNELTWNTFRNHCILEYEIPKYDGDLGIPNAYVPVSRTTREQKIDVLMECFPSQRAKPWFTRDTFQAIACLRGIECQAEEGFAEAFYSRKALLGL